MSYDPKIHHRRSIRLPGHDYAGGGAYSITTCIQDKSALLGQVVENQMVLSPAGRIVEREWRALSARYPSVVLDAHQVMPNHFHGIIVIPGSALEPSLAKATGAPVIQPDFRDAGRHGLATAKSGVGPGLAPAKADASVGPTPRIGLAAVAGAFKSLSAIAVNKYLARIGKHVWQEDYYEHIIRDVDELEKIRDYIIHNPECWLEDLDNPDVGEGIVPG
jgi:REP element-mobilizing transposase RayT